MDGIARSRCQIRVLGRDERDAIVAFGCGVIVGPRLALTCTHVIADALNLPENRLDGEYVQVRIPGDSTIDLTMRVVRAWPVDPADPALAGIERFHDVCLLEITDLPFPATTGTRVATLCEDLPENGTILVGSGTSVELSDVTLSCELGEVTGSRSKLTSPQADKAIRPGCSGAGLFLPGRGLVGMVTEGQGRMAGFMIHAAVLAEAIRKATAATPAIAPAAAASREAVHTRLFREIRELDREPQESDFDTHLRRSQTRRSGLVCALAGFDSDRPDICRDRLSRDALELLDCAIGDKDDVDPVDFPLPSLSEMSADEALLRLKNRLKRESGAASVEPEDLVAQLDALPVPLIGYTRIDEDMLKRPGNRDLLLRWAEFVDATTRGRVALKFIHFLVIHLRSRADVDEEALGKRFRDLIRQLNGAHGESDEAPIVRVQLLRRVYADDVQTWVRRAGAALTLDRELVTTIRIRASEQFPDDSKPRFAEVAAWIRQLNLQSEEA